MDVRIGSFRILRGDETPEPEAQVELTTPEPKADVIPIRPLRRKAVIGRWTGTSKKGAPGRFPRIELDLAPNQRILSFEVEEVPATEGAGGRALTEWKYVAIVETDLQVGFGRDQVTAGVK